MSTNGTRMRLVFSGAPRAILALVSTLALTLIASPSVALGALEPAIAVSPQGIPTFTLNGAGYGHGIGLSQYGARGWAANGKTGEWIAKYYFAGSSIGTAPSHTIRVHLDKAASYSNEGYTRSSYTVRPGHSGLKAVANGATIAYGTYRIEPVGTSSVRMVNTSTGSIVVGTTSQIAIAETGGSPNLMEVVSLSGNYNTARLRHRGQLIFTASGGKVRGVVSLSMDNYLYGVVPRESPASWPLAALQAQAIVARSYAYVSGGTLFCTTSSQVYNGHSSYNTDGSIRYWEAQQTNTAVSSTSGRYVKYGTSVVQTFFSSSSGGHTANIEDVWRSATPKPYYRGVDDPYDPTYSPYSPWDPPVKMDGKTMAAKLAGKTANEPSGTGSTVWVAGLTFDRAESGYVRDVTVKWSNGAVSDDITGDEFRNALGLRSTKVYLYYYPTTRIGASDRYSTAVDVSKRLYPTSGARAIVVASGEDAKFADALTASALAGAVNAPVLLCSRTSVSSGTLAEVARLKAQGATKLYVVGGTGTISSDVERALGVKFGATARRIAGSDRYDTAGAVAREMRAVGASTASVIIASGEVWPDAALASSLAVGTGRPVLLAARSKLPSATIEALKDLAPTSTMVVGGSGTLPDAVVSKIRPAPSVRFGLTGDRFTLAADIANWAIANAGYSAPSVYLVTAARFPDSITGGVLAGRAKQPLLMTWPSSLPAGTAKFLSARRSTIKSVTIVGGTGSVGEGAYIGLCKALN